MHIRLLGTAAGGGFPQWNCHCPVCTVARTDPARAKPRTQSSVAVSGDGERWFLLNASPDIRAQVATLPTFATIGSRHVPFEGIVLSDAEIDHSFGLALIRECRELTLFVTPPVHDILEGDSRLLPLLRAFATVSVHPMSVGTKAELTHRDGSASGLTVEALPLSSASPRFSNVILPGAVSALLVRDSAGSMLAYVPGCASIDGPLREALATANVLLFDGTFWSDDELRELGISERSAIEMGHIPMSGANGSLEALSGFTWCERIFVHINNTNPVLLENSAQRREVEAAGFQVGFDGMELVV